MWNFFALILYFICQASQAQAIKIKKPVNTPVISTPAPAKPTPPESKVAERQIDKEQLPSKSTSPTGPNSSPSLSPEQMEEICNKAEPSLLEALGRISKGGKLTQIQRDSLQQAIKDHKPEAIRTFLTGKIDPKFETRLKAIVPEYRLLPPDKREELFKSSKTVTQSFFVDNLFRIDGLFGPLFGDKNSFGVAQLKAKFFEDKKIKMGEMLIEDIHLEFEAGYPKNGLILVSGKITDPGSNFSIEGSLGSLSYDHAKEIFEVNAVESKLRYKIVPWLSTYAGAKIGYRSYKDGDLIYLDPVYGLEAHMKGDRLEARAYIEGQYRPVENNAVFNCGGSVEIEFLQNDFIKMNGAIISRYSRESNPQIKGNSTEMFNGVGLSGTFGN